MKSHWNLIVFATIFACMGPVNTANAYPTTPSDLSIEKTADKDAVAPGDLITYTLLVASADEAGPARDTVIRDYLPDGLAPVSWSWTRNNDMSGQSIVESLVFGPDQYVWAVYFLDPWSNPPLQKRFLMQPNTSFLINLTARVDPSYSLDTIENRALIECEPIESNYDNNESTVITRVIHPTIPAPGAALLAGIGAAIVGCSRRRNQRATSAS
ncbi:MAG: hypothetical protein ACYS8Z_20320 [Planctomycetota bacterium]